MSRFTLLIVFSSMLMIFPSQMGCDTTSPTELLEECFAEFKPPKREFLELISQVDDKASATDLMPKLIDVQIRLVSADRKLFMAERTKARSALAIQREIQEFKAEQNLLLKEEVARLQRHPEIMEVMEPFLKKIELVGPASY